MGLEPSSRQVQELLSHLEKSSELSRDDLTWLQHCSRLDELAWNEEFGQARDVSELGVERNILRYSPVPVQIRLSENGSVTEALRVVLAGLRSGSEMSISIPDEVSAELLTALRATGLSVTVESDQSWTNKLSGAGDTLTNARIRLIGAPASVVTAATDGRPDVAVYDGDVVLAGRVELLPFMREQAVSITAHRFGTPNHLSDALI